MGEVLVSIEKARLSLRSEGVDTPVLRGLDLTLRQGEHTAILGGNGAGKSTLLRLIRGEAWLNHAQGGRICWHTEEGEETSPLAGRGMTGMVSAAMQEQYVRQGWDCSGEDVLLTAFADSPLLYAKPEAAQMRAAHQMAVTMRCQGLLTRSVDTLSQGQLRLLLCARVLLRRPRLLLLDEFLDGLDASTRAHALHVLEEQAAQSHDMTMIFTAHREADIPAFVQRRLYLHEGLLHPTPPAPPAVQRKSAVTDAARETAPVQASLPPLIDVRHATIYIDRIPVLHDVTWQMCAGEHWCIHGGNGAGKSTLLRLLAGDEYPAAGGSIARHLPRHGGSTAELESIRRAIRLVSDKEQALYGYDLTGLELVLSGFDNVIGQYREFTRAEEAEALAWMRQLGVAELAPRRMRALSTGQLRRLLLARAMVGGPEILLLDEPCSGLDAVTREHFLELLQDMSAHVQLVFVSHHAGDRIPALNREAKMEDGRLYFV